MAQDATLHVKLDRETEERLNRLARTRGKSKGQLVREAIAACYQASFAEIPLQHSHALAAYQGGYISLGKLARVMGMHALDARRWLADHGIEERCSLGDEDAVNA